LFVTQAQESDDLPDDAIVVRGGLMQNIDEMVEDARDEMARVGYPGLSVRAGVGVTVEELVRAGQLPNNQIRVSTAGRVRKDGYSFSRISGPYHYNIVLPSLDPKTVAQLSDSFDEPQANPVPRDERRRR
jgi:hypothetical protein